MGIKNIILKIIYVILNSFRGLCELFGVLIMFALAFGVCDNGKSVFVQTMENIEYAVGNWVFAVLYVLGFFALGYLFKTTIDKDGP